jgi:hypothetical protein
VRLNVCIILLCVSSTFALGQSTGCLPDAVTDSSDKTQGLSDTLTTFPKSIVVPNANASEYFDSWSDLTSSEDKPAPISRFNDFGKLIETKACPFSEKYLYVFHITDWSDETKRDENPGIDFKSSAWYAYRYTGKSFEVISAKEEKLPSIYGKTNVILLSISRISTVKNRETEAPSLEYTIASSERNASNVTALEVLVDAVLGLARSTNKGVQETTYKFNVKVFAVSTKPLQAPFDVTLTATAKPASTANGQAPSVSQASNTNASSDDKNTSKSAAASTSTPAQEADCRPLASSGKCYFSRTFTVEAYQYWNVGVNIVARGPRENKYALSSSEVVTQTHTFHAPIIAAFDVSPWARKLPMDKFPYMQVGVPLSGSAFHMPYFGMAQPLRFTKKWLSISVYGGVVLMKQTFPKTIQVGQTTTTAAFNNDLKTDWPVKAVYGIEVPVSSIIGKVKSSVGSGK